MKYLTYIFCILPLIVFLYAPVLISTHNVFAQESTSGEPQKGLVQCDKDPCDLSDLTAVIQKTLEWVFMFATFIVVIMFMYAGFLLITAGGDTNQIQKAKTVFKRVVIGFIIMFVAVLSVRQLLVYIGANEFFQGIIQ